MNRYFIGCSNTKAWFVIYEFNDGCITTIIHKLSNNNFFKDKQILLFMLQFLDLYEVIEIAEDLFDCFLLSDYYIYIYHDCYIQDNYILNEHFKIKIVNEQIFSI